jgi:hypothetical protein
MEFTRIRGEDLAVPIDVNLDCEKVQLKGKYNTKNEKIDAKCTIKNCQLPQALELSDVNAMIDCAEDAVDDETLGKRVGNMKLKGDEISGNIRSKGTPVN